MAKKFQLSIPEPCHEDWDKMHPSGKGRFCDSCQKQVVDFSSMSDMEIAQFFKKPSTGSLCGRFMSDQLERTIEMPKKRIPWLRYFFQIALPAFLTTTKASAQGQVRMDMVKEKVQQEPDKVDCAKPLGEQIAEAKHVVSVADALAGRVLRPLIKQVDTAKVNGRVVDENNKPVPFATVMVKGTKVPVATDENGLFIIIAKKGDILEVSRLGYQPIQIVCKELVTGDIVLKESIIVNEEYMMLKGMFSLAPPVKTKTNINGKVIDEKGNPVPFATVFIEELDKTIMADEEGFFKVNPTKKWYSMALNVSSAGFKNETAVVNAPAAKKDTIYIQLKANDILPEVKVVAYPSVSRKSYMLGGAVTGVRVQTSFIDTIKNFFTKKMMPSVYPNPVGAGASLNIAVGQQEEGMYVFDLITANGQSVQKRELWIDKDARVLNFEVPAVSAGVYFLRMQHKQTGKATTEKIVVK